MFAEPRTLEEMQFHNTAYGAEVYADQKLVGRLGFYGKKTKRQLIDAAFDHGKFVGSFLTEDELDGEFSYKSGILSFNRASDGKGGRVYVRWGATERDVRSEIERNS